MLIVIVLPGKTEGKGFAWRSCRILPQIWVLLKNPFEENV
jgi:hypothetical protein